MKKEQLIKIIKEEIARELANDPTLVNEIYDLEQVKYSSSVRKEVDSLGKIMLLKDSLNLIKIVKILEPIQPLPP